MIRVKIEIKGKRWKSCVGNRTNETCNRGRRDNGSWRIIIMKVGSGKREAMEVRDERKTVRHTVSVSNVERSLPGTKGKKKTIQHDDHTELKLKGEQEERKAYIYVHKYI